MIFRGTAALPGAKGGGAEAGSIFKAEAKDEVKVEKGNLIEVRLFRQRRPRVRHIYAIKLGMGKMLLLAHPQF